MILRKDRVLYSGLDGPDNMFDFTHVEDASEGLFG
jgi:hypothetical protein